MIFTGFTQSGTVQYCRSSSREGERVVHRNLKTILDFLLLSIQYPDTIEPENHFMRESKWNQFYKCIDLLEFHVISPYIDTKSIHILNSISFDSISILSKGDSLFHL